MTIATVRAYDATHDNIRRLPPGQAAGYATGYGGVPWTASDWAAHPGAVRIDQSPVNTALNELCDVLDVERGAATFADCAPWAEAAFTNYASGKRAGQRSPAIYMSLSAVTPVVNALIAGGITQGPGLWIANWDLTEAQAHTVVQISGGPFPVIGVQYRNAGLYDISVFSLPWLDDTSGPLPAADWTLEAIMSLPTLTEGARDGTGMLLVHRVQNDVAGIGRWNNLGPVTALADDGVFGPATTAGVKAVQQFFGLTADGAVGKLTWMALIGAPAS